MMESKKQNMETLRGNETSGGDVAIPGAPPGSGVLTITPLSRPEDGPLSPLSCFFRPLSLIKSAITITLSQARFVSKLHRLVLIVMLGRRKRKRDNSEPRAKKFMSAYNIFMQEQSKIIAAEFAEKAKVLAHTQFLYLESCNLISRSPLNACY